MFYFKAKLIATLRVVCDSYVNGVSEITVVDKYAYLLINPRITTFTNEFPFRLKGEITMFFDRWYHTWPLQIGDRERRSFSSYFVEESFIDAYMQSLRYLPMWKY